MNRFILSDSILFDMMEYYSKRFWILVVVLFIRGLCETEGCLEHERVALLHLKSFFNDSLPYGEDIRGSNCCEWEGVKCSVTGRRVIQLSLNGTRQLQTYRYLNASLFLPFTELKSLDLSGNDLSGFADNEDFGKVASALRKLEILDLSKNRLNESILQSLSELSSLKFLYLGRNLFTGSNHTNGFKWLSRLHNLETLDLGVNILENNFLLQVGGLSSLRTLNLASNQLIGSVNMKELDRMRKLRNLDLSANFIESFMLSQDNKSQQMMNLEELYLTNNQLQNSSFGFISGLSNLKTLHIDFNKLQGSIDIKELNKLAKLKQLDMNNNEIECLCSFDDKEKQLKLIDLEELNLSSNLLDNRILGVVRGLSHVKFLNVGFNKLKGSTSIKELEAFHDLEELNFSGNELHDLETIGALTSLKWLALFDTSLTGPLSSKGWCNLWNLEELVLRENRLEGSIPSCFHNLTSLRLLDISNNHIEVLPSFISLANNSHLKFLFIDQNSLVISEPTTFQIQIPKFQLKSLSMSNCSTKGLPKELPNFLYYQNDLRYVDLSYNQFGGLNPSWLLENNTRLQQILMIDNSFKGTLQLPKHANVDMIAVDMSGNQMRGQIPMNICSTFPHLRGLFLSRNAFEGNIPLCLGGLKSLDHLDLSFNKFSGRIVLEELVKSNSLRMLRLSSNNLSGKIPPVLFSITFLELLYLDGNHFDGEIPALIDISNVGGSLTDIDLSNNQLSGKVPGWISNLWIQTLDFSNNHFDGHIPSELCNLGGLRFLDLSGNNFFGTVPSCFSSLSRLEHLHLSRNRLSGPLPHVFYNKSSLVTLDLSQNNFTGKIPYWISSLSALRILLLKANHFKGKIPSQICQLNSLSIIDLSQNKLVGHIPSCFSNLTLEPTSAKSFQSRMAEFAFGLVGLGSKHFYPGSYVEEQVLFTTKKGLYTYSGNILDYMSGIDLSCNNLTGQIPPEMGNMSELHSLNLSHNSLTGIIPSTFSRLRQVESLDLSHNKLSGIIPIQLMELNSLAIFNVSYNNLSGNIPHEKAQFATFDESSYSGNPFLCGPPKHESCTPTTTKASENEEESGFLDKQVFCVTLVVSYTIVLVTIGVALYINPYWRRAWFYFIQECIDSCYYFILDNVIGISIFRRS